MPLNDNMNEVIRKAAEEFPSGDDQNYLLRTSSEKAITTDGSGNPALNSVIGGGELTVSGLSLALKITNITIGTTATAIPLTPLTNRNSIIIHNKSTETIFFGNSDVSSSGVNEGWEVVAGSYFSLDITDSIVIYAISTAASSALKIMELA